MTDGFLQAISARWRCPRPKEWVELHQCKSTVWMGWTQCRLLPTPKTSSESQKKIRLMMFLFENPGFSCLLETGNYFMFASCISVQDVHQQLPGRSCYHFWRKKSCVHIIFDRVLYIPVVQGFFYQQHLMKLVWGTSCMFFEVNGCFFPKYVRRKLIIFHWMMCKWYGKNGFNWSHVQLGVSTIIIEP